MPDQVAMLVSQLARVSQILHDTSFPPNGRGEISRRVQVVTHHVPAAAEAAERASVTVQAVLDVDSKVWQGQAAAGARLERAVTSALEGLDGVRGAASRVVAVVAFPVPEE